MKLIFLGTGPAEALPRIGHTDMLCADARKPNSKSRRGRSSTFVQIKGKNILIDVSPDFLFQARRERLKKIDAILITHAHDDAYGGLPNLGKWMKIMRHKPVSLFGHRSTIRAIKNYIPPIIKPVNVPEFHIANVAGIKVRFIPVNHGIRYIATFGFLFDNDLFYASDMDEMSGRAVKIVSGTKILVLDGAFWDRKHLKGHFTTPEVIVFAKNLKPKRLIITQSGHSYPSHEIAQRALKKLARKQKCAFSAQLAYDGLKINI